MQLLLVATNRLVGWFVVFGGAKEKRGGEKCHLHSVRASRQLVGRTVTGWLADWRGASIWRLWCRSRCICRCC